MKKIILLLGIVFLLSSAVLISCDNSSSSDSDSGSEATKLGATLTLTGTIDKIFTPPNVNDWAGSSFSNPEEDGYSVFELNDETDNTPYDQDTNGDETLNLSYGTPDSAQLYDPAGGGITSSNSAARVTTAIIEVCDGAAPPNNDYNDDEIRFIYASSEGVMMYAYYYSTAETTLDGEYYDGESTYVFDNVTIFEGWNQLKGSTSDGSTFTYSGGEITGGHWTYMDNSEPVLIAM